MAWVNEQRTTDVTRVLKAPGAELSQNACGERNKKYFVSSVFSSVYMHTYTYEKFEKTAYYLEYPYYILFAT